MLAARIHFGQKLVKPKSTPSLNFTESSGVVTLHLTITLDENAYILADDEDNTADPAIKNNFRDARIGKELLRIDTLDNIEITEIDIAEDAANFTIQGTLSTKIPGTGYEFRRLLENNFKI
jgi:hypothetical protein